MHRLYDQWGPLEDRANPFFSNFFFAPLAGIGKETGDEFRKVAYNCCFGPWRDRS